MDRRVLAYGVRVQTHNGKWQDTVLYRPKYNVVIRPMKKKWWIFSWTVPEEVILNETNARVVARTKAISYARGKMTQSSVVKVFVTVKWMDRSTHSWCIWENGDWTE